MLATADGALQASAAEAGDVGSEDLEPAERKGTERFLRIGANPGPSAMLSQGSRNQG